MMSEQLVAAGVEVAIDVGSSEVRMVDLITMERETADNQYLDIESDRDISRYEGYTRNVEDNLELIVTQYDNLESDFSETVRYLQGTLLHQISSAVRKPNSLTGKVRQASTYRNIITALTMMAYNKGLTSIQPVVGVLIPPSEYFSNEGEYLKQRLTGKYIVKLPRLDYELEIDIQEVKITVQPECFVAFGKYFTGDDVNIEDFAEARILSIDIGASTTDLTVVDGLKAVNHAFETFRFGGNKMVTKFSELYSRDHRGNKPDVRACERAIATGKLKRGSIDIDVTEYVKLAKQDYADTIFPHLSEYFTSKELLPESIDMIMFLGGGSLPTQELGDLEPAVPSVGVYLMETIKQISEYTNGIYIDNARWVNVEGLVIAMGR